MAEYDFSGKVAFVTGGARGQGRSHAVTYAENGADVVVLDICDDDPLDAMQYEVATEQDLEETVELIEAEDQEALGIKADIRDEDQVEAAVDQAVEEMGRIDFLANNAGVWTVSSAVEMSETMWDETIDINLKGAWLCSKHVGKHMIERGGGGKIISTASGAAFVGFPDIAHYVASKHGLVGLTKTLALELAEYDINVNAVCPSTVESDMSIGVTEAIGEEALEEGIALTGPHNIFDPGTQLQPDDITGAYMWLSSEDSKYVTGTALKVDSGLTAK
jgi:SDR family mycofactocin-dependent oxidoreductase